MLGAATVLYLLAVPLCRTLAELTMGSLRNASPKSFDAADAVERLRNTLQLVAPGVLAMLLAMAVAALVSNIVQVGFLIAPEALQPKFSRLNPFEGAKRILSVSALVRLAASLAKLLIVVGLSTWSIRTMLPGFVQMIGLEPRATLFHMEHSIVRLAFQLSSALISLALADFLFQRWRFQQDLLMTKQEVREEMKEMEGDPYIRQRRRDAHRKLAQARELQQVRTADVIITNPTHIAVAVKYDPSTMPAPIVVAKGMGEIAARIRRIATDNDIPVIERKELARALYRQIKVGQAIPIEMYQVFVEIMAYVYRLTGRTPPTFI